MVAYYGATLMLFLWNPVFCMTFWIFTHLEGLLFFPLLQSFSTESTGMILLCAISYLWHAFVEESARDPDACARCFLTWEQGSLALSWS